MAHKASSGLPGWARLDGVLGRRPDWRRRPHCQALALVVRLQHARERGHALLRHDRAGDARCVLGDVVQAAAERARDRPRSAEAPARAQLAGDAA